MRAPVNSFEFQPCGRTPQVDNLSISLDHRHYIADSELSSFTVRTTRVSNPVRSPHFRASASIVPLPAAFAIGVLCHIYAFHRYLTHSAGIIHILVCQFQRHPQGLAPTFHRWLDLQPTHPLNPINPDNACTLRITAAAGTELAGAYSLGTVKFLPQQKEFTLRKVSSSTRRCCFRLSPIEQYSLLLPPVGVWTVSQFQCDWSSSQTSYAS